ncbi:MAG: 50S ribosomal protein L24 [Pseudobdellovibrionaceae bacterium]
MKLKIKKGDMVEVITGSSKGTRGTVLEVRSATLQIKIQGANVQTHYDRKEGLLKKEGFLNYSNVKLVEAASAAGKKKTTKKKAASKTA